MDIIDSHHHLWDTNAVRYTLFDTIPALNRPFLLPAFEAEASRHSVKRAVCVEAASAGADGLTETRWLLEQTRASRVVTRIVAWAPLGSPTLGSHLDKLGEMQDGRIVGLRRGFEFEPADFARRDETIAGVKMAAARGYSVDLVFFSPAFPAILDLVKACPEVAFVLDHLGKPRIREGVLQPWKDQIIEIANRPNVVCKISGMITEAHHHDWMPSHLEPYMWHGIEAFGWDRVMFGSDWPVSLLAGEYDQWLAAARSILKGAAESDQRKFFHDNAERFYFNRQVLP